MVKGVDPKEPTPNHPGHANDGTFTGENPAATGRAAHKELSEKMLVQEGFITNRMLPGSQGVNKNGGLLIPDGHKVNEDDFITDVAEIKPDTSSGIRKMGPQMNGYMEYAKSYNSNLSAKGAWKLLLCSPHAFPQHLNKLQFRITTKISALLGDPAVIVTHISTKGMVVP